MVPNLKDVKVSTDEDKSDPEKRRFIFGGWNNYTAIEKQFVQEIKNEMKKRYSLDLDKKKPYGPRKKNGKHIEGDPDLIDGIDLHFTDEMIHRFCVGRGWNLETLIPDLKSHLEWR